MDKCWTPGICVLTVHTSVETVITDGSALMHKFSTGLGYSLADP